MRTRDVQKSLILDIKHYSINDGPGIRLTIFFKGCPLSCVWCHNPESISPHPQKMYAHGKCIGCALCVEHCPHKACRLTEEGIRTDTNLCTSCGQCAEVCPSKATEISGTAESTEELLHIIEKETLFFDQSGGGVTFSGGEPLMHRPLLLKLLKACGARGIHRAVDTTGFCTKETLLEVARHTEMFLYDLKMMDPVRHKKYTGVDNRLILANLQALAETGAEIRIRIPVIEGVNADKENIGESAEFVAHLAGDKKAVDLLPYHNIAAGKYQRLGGMYGGHGMAEPGTNRLAEIIDIFSARGLTAEIGG